MINPFAEINWKPDRKAMLDFGKALIIGGVILLTVVSIYRGAIRPSHRAFVLQIAFTAIIIAGFIAYLFPSISKPLYLAWYFFGACVGIVVANLLFGIFYFLFFTPIAVVIRSRREDPLQLKRPSTTSLWLRHKTQTDLKRYFRQY